MTPFHDLYQRYSRDVFRFALYFTGNHAIAEDVTSETFIRVWSSPEPVRMETVKAYLLVIARNLCLMEQRRAAHFIDPPVETAPTPSLPREIEARDELRRVLGALQQLPEADRAAILLRAESDLSYEQIAAILRLPVATVKVRVHRARLKLAEVRSPQRGGTP